MGAIGNDEQGAFIREECEAVGLPTAGLVTKTGVPTAHTHVMSVAGQSRTFFYQGGANDALGLEDFPKGTFAATSARIFYLGYLTLLGALDELSKDGATPAARVLERAKQAGLTTCVDLVSMPHPRFAQIVRNAAPFMDVLVANEIEAALTTDTPPETDAPVLLAKARLLRDMGVKQAVVLHCVERAVWVGADGAEHVFEITPLPSDQIASNLGAGDAFCAGLLYGIHEELSPVKAIQIANATARASLKGLTATSAIPALAELDLETQKM
jgi:sugar/nucleoside kinase (ribokinase family)